MPAAAGGLEFWRHYPAPRSPQHGADLVRFGATKSALTLYRQASRLAPTRSEPYALVLKLAERVGDDEAIQWASTGILTYTWPSDYRRRHRLALDVAADTATALRKVGKEQRAGELEEAVASGQQGDQEELNHLVLPHDHLLQLLLHQLAVLAEFLQHIA